MRPTIDDRSGDIEPTGNNYDVALQGKGYLAVSANGKTHLTRNGEFMLDRTGKLVLSTNPQQAVLDDKQKPIILDSTAQTTFAVDGTITQNGKVAGKLGLFNVADASQLRKLGGTLLSMPEGADLQTATPTVRSGFVERSNVDPATEMTQLMDAQRQLEANANMIHIQDETLDKLVNDVGRVS